MKNDKALLALKKAEMNNQSDAVRMAKVHDFGKNDVDDNDDDAFSGFGFNASSNPSNAVFSTPAPMQRVSNNNGGEQGIEEDMLINYNEMAKKGAFSQALFRDTQINQVLGTLSSKKRPNALLTGHAGVGKTQIVEELARRLVNDEPIAKALLGDAVLYELPLAKIVSGSSYVGQLEEKLYQVIEFAKNPKNKCILFIDEVHLITGSNQSETYGKISQILKPELGRGTFKTIGATTTQEAASFLADPAFNRRWSEIKVPELSEQETAQILNNIRHDFETHHNVVLPESVIDHIVSISEEFKPYGSHRPDSAIALMDKAMSDARIKRIELMEDAKSDPTMKLLLQAQPKQVVTVNQLKHSAMTLLTGDETLYSDNISQLEDVLSSQIIGQNVAKEKITDAVKRLSLGLTRQKKPVSFMLAGPSGTGKTEMAKQVAQSVFGSKDRMVYLNMTEFSDSSSMTRITGSPDGYIGSNSKRELPFDTLETNPRQLIVLDEFEKAHTDVQRLFMQALDEGTVKTNRNKAIDFSQAIIMATTNAGVVEMSKPRLGFSNNVDEPVEHSTNDIINMLSHAFDKELLNRFESIIPFNSVSKADYVQILAVKYNQLIQEVISNRKDLSFIPTHIELEDAANNDVLTELANKTYSRVANGRPAEKTIRQHIEDSVLDNPNSTQFNLL